MGINTRVEQTGIYRLISLNELALIDENPGESECNRPCPIGWNVIALSESLQIIRQTVARLSQPVLLESTLPDPLTSRWSIFAAEPIETLSIRQDKAVVQSGSSTQVISIAPKWLSKQAGKVSAESVLKAWIHQWLSAVSAADSPLTAPFKGGIMGWVGYDFGWQLEKLPRLIPDRDGWDDLRLGLYDTFIIYDHKYDRAQLVACDLAQKAAGRSVSDRILLWRKQLQWTCEQAELKPWNGLEVNPVLSRSDYESRIRRVLDYLASGDIFQANFTHRFEAHGPGDPLALYERLARISPAPFAAFSSWDDKAIISSSPEWFYRQDGKQVMTRPIKGTRPRGQTPEEDAANKAELLASLKDKAELTMIVDLERNDLGRVSEFGSVKVNESMKLESYAQVHHLVAEVEGRLRSDKDAVDLLAAMFPGGSITGAPKIRAMEIIEELETHRRGPYTGSIGYISLDGHSAWNIAIRTVLKSGNSWSYNVGGGIVIDSQPGDEYEETLTKGRGMKLAIEGADS